MLLHSRVALGTWRRLVSGHTGYDRRNYRDDQGIPLQNSQTLCYNAEEIEASGAHDELLIAYGPGGLLSGHSRAATEKAESLLDT